MFADLHCHPALYSYNRIRNSDEENDPKLFNPWNVFRSSKFAKQRAIRATRYTQVTPPIMAQSGLRLAFASITPIEKAFFTGGEFRHQTDWKMETLAIATGITPALSVGDFLRGEPSKAKSRALKLFRNSGPYRLALQRVFMGYPLKRIKYIRSESFDYWDEFLREYDYYQNANNHQTDHGRYVLIENAEQLRETIADPHALAMVHTIEGAHTFSVAPNEEIVPDDVLFERIDTLKNLDWPLLFITVAHHFDNGICGHAKSLMDVGSFVMDQTPRMNEGLDPERGQRVFKALLGLDENLKDDGTRRVLVDVKHMSPRARKTYYDTIVRPYNAAKKKKQTPISVVMSHAGYSGMRSLQQLIDGENREKDGHYRDGFLAWGINFCDEDVRAVHESEGLIGICFDERIMAADRRGAGVLVQHIFAAVDAIWDEDDYADTRHKIWDCISIGSDFDGVIDPISRYPTANELHLFKDDLQRALEQNKHTRGIEEIGVDEIVEKICWKNGYNFALRHLPKS